MSTEQLIPAGEFCTFHQVELSFLETLPHSGLITITVRNGVAHLVEEQLPQIEKFARWHYQLSINTEGIEALSHMLDRVQILLAENTQLRSRLSWYEQTLHSGTTLDYEP